MHKDNKNQGFSLIELMYATALVGIVSWAVLALTHIHF